MSLARPAMAVAEASRACAIWGRACSTASATFLSSVLIRRAISSADKVSSAEEARLDCSVFSCRMVASEELTTRQKPQSKRLDDCIVESGPDLFDGLRTTVRPGAVG